MALTKDNFTDLWPEVKKTLGPKDEDFINAGDFVSEALEFYGKDEEITKTVDLFFEICKKKFNDDEAKPADDVPPTPKRTKSPKPSPKPSKQPKAGTAKAASKYDSLENKECIQVLLARRFAKLHGMKFNAEVKDKAINILNALQKAIINHDIRKEGFGRLSAYAPEMRKMQAILVKMANMPADASRDVVIKDIEDFRRVARAEGGKTSAAAMRSFQRLSTKKEVSKKEAETTLAKVDKVISRDEAGNYADTLAEMRDALVAFIAGDTKTIEAREQVLDGISALVDPSKKKA